MGADSYDFHIQNENRDARCVTAILRVCSSIVSSGKSLTLRTCSIIVVREIIYRHSIIKYIYIGIIIINCTYYDLTLLFFSNPNSKKDEGLKFGTAKIICYLLL